VSKRTCSVDGCDRRHKSRGFCDPHYLRWLATGDPEPGRPIGSRKPPARTECSIDGCDRLVLARGWCAAHYQRWKAHGDPLLGSTVRKPRRERSKCSAHECDRESKTVGLCNRHYQRQRLNGTTDVVGKKTCSVDECAKQSFSEDFCRTHWTRWKEFGDPLVYRQCSIEGCDRFAPAGKRGWCVMHYTRWSKHGDVGEAAHRLFQPPHAPADGHQWCTSCHAELPFKDFQRDKTTASGYSRVCRNCHRDVHIAHIYGISATAYRQLLNEQGGACRICRKAETATHQSGTLRRLAVDHDHRCCPGKKSCGKCVRGLLCARCNSAIGLFDEDRDIILAALEYLTA
jgi:hypothetical protein